jgi:hypothetical protein
MSTEASHKSTEVVSVWDVPVPLVASACAKGWHKLACGKQKL